MNSSAPNMTIVGWQDEPDGRGTFGILKSCIITLALCVYTALHLNIYPRGTKRWQIVLYKLKWVLIGAFAPEIVVYFAFCQRESAKSLYNRVNQVLAEEQKADPENERQHKWTMTHSFYTLMGGFAFETYDKHEQEYIPGSPTLYLYPAGAKVLAEIGLLPDISREFIRDKSKADSFAKVVVITQASWMILQVIMRKAAHLKITALELNTVAHAVCALLIYLLWWEKPLDIQEPFVMVGDWTRSISAHFWMSSKVQSRRRPYMYGMMTRREHPELNDLTVYQRGNGDNSADRFQKLQNLKTEQEEPIPLFDADGAAIPGAIFEMTPDHKLHPIGLGVKRNARRWKARVHRLGYGEVNVEKVVKVNLTTLTRWSLFRQADKEFKGIRPALNHLTDREPKNSWPWAVIEENQPPDPYVLGTSWMKQVKALVDEEVTNVYNDVMEEGIAGAVFLEFMVFIFCAAAYGGIHIAAWNSYFPTPLEHLLWKISSVGVAGVGVPVSLLIVYLYADSDDGITTPYRAFRKKWSEDYAMGGVTRKLFEMAEVSIMLFIMGGILLLGLFYIFARGYLVVEAFLSLRMLPADAFVTPEWTQYLAHF